MTAERKSRVVTRVNELRAEADRVRAAGGKVGFLGTSGNLHEGHLSLIRRMRAECDLGIMPLFLKPVPGLLEFEPVGAYARVRTIRFDGGFCRRDIGHRALRR